MHVSRLRMGQALDGVVFGERECGGDGHSWRENMWLKYRNDWGWWGLFTHGPVARNGEGVSCEEKGGRKGGCGG